MSELLKHLSNLENGAHIEKRHIVEKITRHIEASNYDIHEIDAERPWGAFFRLSNENADDFIKEFFPDLNPIEARLGRDDVELSPKILLVAPGHRLSWQYHHRRAERWAFLTDGAYHKSLDDEMGEVVIAKAGESVQFEPRERHRLVGREACYSFIAEIWQHTDMTNPSSEEDNIRLSDDYGRNK